jgi:hypothetical protein
MTDKGEYREKKKFFLKLEEKDDSEIGSPLINEPPPS